MSAAVPERRQEDGAGNGVVLTGRGVCEWSAKDLLLVVDMNYGSLQAILWNEATYPLGAKRL